jgi:hypothetical protein
MPDQGSVIPLNQCYCVGDPKIWHSVDSLSLANERGGHSPMIMGAAAGEYKLRRGAFKMILSNQGSREARAGFVYASGALG